MQFCQPHWDALKEAIQVKGLEALIADSQEQAMRNATSQAADGLTVDNFDPLMIAHNMILARSLDAFGMQIMTPKPDGSLHRCPLCEVKEVICLEHDTPHPELDDEWIDGCTNAVVDMWKDLAK